MLAAVGEIHDEGEVVRAEIGTELCVDRPPGSAGQDVIDPDGEAGEHAGVAERMLSCRCGLRPQLICRSLGGIPRRRW